VANVTGMNRNDAVATLQAQGFTAPVTEAYSDTVPAGDVISQSPGAGTSHLKGDPVALVVSKGKEPRQVPNVVGSTRTDAAAALSAQDFVVTVTGQYSDTVPRNTVISQNPGVSTQDKGSAVALVVSQGVGQSDWQDGDGSALDTTQYEIYETQTLYRSRAKINQTIDTTMGNTPSAEWTVASQSSAWTPWFNNGQYYVAAVSGFREVNPVYHEAVTQTEYHYGHYCKGGVAYGSAQSGGNPGKHTYVTVGSPLPFWGYSSTNANGYLGPDCGYGCTKYFEDSPYPLVVETVPAWTEYFYRDLVTTYVCWKWGEWTTWLPATTPPTADQVESKPQYRFRGKPIS
jgi:hypothetical protein